MNAVAPADADGEPAEPDEQEEDERPEEALDARIDARHAQVHRREPNDWTKGRCENTAGPRTGPKKFTEPVALSSTQPADLPLPRRAFELSFDLVALRARCTREATGWGRAVKGVGQAEFRNLRTISFSGRFATRAGP